MIPLSDENPTIRTPAMTIALLATMAAVWVFYQGAGLDSDMLVKSVCNLGMVPGELTHRAALGTAVPLAPGVECIVDNDPINKFTPFTSMFLHGSWAHLLGNALFFWVFGNNVEDSMGPGRFLLFYLMCGLVAAAAHVFAEPSSAIPTVGASGAISGVLGAYLVLYPRVRVRMLFIFIIFFRVIPVPAWAVLLWWFFLQVISGVMTPMDPEVVSGGVAVWAHVGGFIAGVVLVKLFVNPELHRRRLDMGDAREAFLG
jgi:membrane associated rhomboid family serine protease